MASLKSECAAHLATKQQLNAAAQSLAEEQAQRQGLHAALGQDKAVAAERERGLAAEKARVEAELAAASSRCSEYESMMAAAANEIERLRAQCSSSTAACSKLEASLAGTAAQVEALGRQLEDAERARSLVLRDAQEKGDKLAQMEGECCLGGGVRSRLCG